MVSDGISGALPGVHGHQTGPKVIYLDHAATTPLDPRVLEEMLPYLKHEFGNPSSIHTPGRRVRFRIEEAREHAASLIGAEPSEIIFTSGATESNNTALSRWLHGESGSLATSRLEHKSVLNVAMRGEDAGRNVRFVQPEKNGAIAEEQVERALGEETGLVSLMWVNNETGWISPIDRISAICSERGVVFHSDAVQAAGLLPIALDSGPDLLSLSAHKLNGPKGIGLLAVRNGLDFSPFLVGGSQERGKRGGTEHVAGIAGFVKALTLAVEERSERLRHITALHRKARKLLAEELGPCVVFHSPDPSAQSTMGSPHILSVGFLPGTKVVDGEMLLLNLDVEGICVSGGSACTSGAVEPSHVLSAMRLNKDIAGSTIRISFGKDTTEDEIERAVETIVAVVDRMRKLEGARQ